MNLHVTAFIALNNLIETKQRDFVSGAYVFIEIFDLQSLYLFLCIFVVWIFSILHDHCPSVSGGRRVGRRQNHSSRTPSRAVSGTEVTYASLLNSSILSLLGIAYSRLDISDRVRIIETLKLDHQVHQSIPIMSTDHIPKCYTSTALEHFHGLWFYHLPGQPASMSNCSFWEEMFLNIQPDSPPAQREAITSHSLSATWEQSPNPTLP